MNDHPLDPDEIAITAHALERYAYRRHSKTPEASLRRLLARVRYRGVVEPVRHVNGHVGRTYRQGELKLVVSADHATLITVMRDRPLSTRKRPRPKLHN